MIKKLLVTGSDGLVGSAVRRCNPANAVFATRANGDLTDFKQVMALFEKHRPTHVIHAAAQVGGIGANMNHPGEYFRNNVLINVNVLEAARLHGVDKLLTFLSTCIFPNESALPLHEDSLHAGTPHPTNAAYAHAKRMIDVQSRAYRKEWGCNFITAVGTNIYGPNDNFDLENSHVLPALIHKFYLAKQANTEMRIWGTGNPLREFVFSDDVARLALWAIDNYNEESPIIFTSGIETSIKDVVSLVAEKMDFKGPVSFDTSKPDGQLRKPSDTAKLKRYLPDYSFMAVSSGVAQTIDWFNAKYPDVRRGNEKQYEI